MDGRTRYNKIQKLLKEIVGKNLHLNKLRRRVMIEIGSSENVVRETITLMIDLGLITEKQNLIFHINSNKADI